MSKIPCFHPSCCYQQGCLGVAANHGESWCYLKAFDSKGMPTKYEHCTLNKSNVTGKVKVCGQANGQRDLNQYAHEHTIMDSRGTKICFITYLLMHITSVSVLLLLPSFCLLLSVLVHGMMVPIFHQLQWDPLALPCLATVFLGLCLQVFKKLKSKFTPEIW